MRKIFCFIVLLMNLTSCLQQDNSPLGSIASVGSGPALTDPVTYDNSKDALFAAGSANLGNRYFIYSVFSKIFLDMDNATNAEKRTFNAITDASFMMQPELFGGAPNFYSTRGNSDANTSSLDSNTLPYYTNPTPARAAILIKACKVIIEKDIYLLEALRKAEIYQSSVVANYSSLKLKKLYELFYLGDEMSEEMMRAFDSVAKKAVAGGFNSREQWRLILYLICESPYWQKI